MTNLGVNLTNSIMTMEKPATKEIKNWLEKLSDSNDNTSTKVDCGLKTIQDILFLSRAVQDFSNCGITLNARLLHEIGTYCSKSYNSVQSYLTKTKSCLDGS